MTQYLYSYYTNLPKKNVISVCVCVCVELLKRSKTCTSITLAIFWQYMNLFRGAALTSGFSHVHLFMFLCLLKQF